MKISKQKKQRDFFDKEENQYSPKLILNPPYHTVLEMKAVVERLQDIDKKKLIVDFAAGTGRIAIYLLQKNYSVLAVDLSKKSLGRLKKTASIIGKSSLKTSSTLPRNGVQAVVGADALHHVDLDQYLAKIYNSLIKGGKIIFSEPGAWNISWYVYLPLFYDWEVERGVMNCTYLNLKRKLKRYGFKNIKISGLGLFPRPIFNFIPLLCRFNDWLGSLPVLNLFAYRYIIEADK